MKILIIEDEAKHIEDAKVAVAKNSEINADFAKTFDEAKKLMEENSYDGIISDIFFPRNEKKEISNAPIGWSGVIRSKCYDLLENFGVNYGKNCSDFGKKVVEAADEWMQCRTMHPTGVAIADMALKSKVPVVMCTDTYHHGYKTQPICSWAGKNEVAVFDAYPKSDEYTASASEKNWTEAIERLSIEIEYGLKGYEASEKIRELRKER